MLSNIKNKNLVYLILVFVFLGTALYFILKNKSGSFEVDRNAFSIEDTASIDKIFLSDKSGRRIILNKKPNRIWFVNEKYRVNDEVINHLLDALKRVEVKSPVSKNSVLSVLKNLSTSAIQVEIYTGEKLNKKYFVGQSTGDDLGTYMILENSEVPIIAHIPGFDGYLTVRYSTKKEDWRNKDIFRVSPQEIKSIHVEFPGDKKNSFLLELVNENYVRLSNFNGDTANENIDPEFLRFYLSKFTKLGFEFRENGLKESYKDSVLKMANFCNVELTLRGGKSQKVQLCNRFFDKAGNLIAFDTNPENLDPLRLWIYFPKEKEWVAGQLPVVQPISTNYYSFFKQNSAK